jgi:hypothetical protein
MRALLDTQNDVFWLQDKREKHGNALFESTKNLVINWWTIETTISPNHKDVMRRRTAVKMYESHAIHYLQVFQVHFFFLLRL